MRDRRGRRKYLTGAERKAFLKTAQELTGQRKALCELLYYTGCRISEALALDADGLDFGESTVVIHTLKQRDRIDFRDIPVPIDLLIELKGLAEGSRVFSISRPTAWRIVKRVMANAGIVGIHATPKGLRHGFAVAHGAAKTHPEVLQHWMGHAEEATTKIYLRIRGEEAYELAKAVW
ncbi:tyrosine-type recombinase/integrase [Cerasicoccus frondis]|uniref:tyrosine-type recombinase/integrase n=1 Tax=Cerasicoccus frondis TaxID=490090 RepID=UPI002852BD1C|nr:site-specific integrase [Cerasicoccus frondis]